MALGQNLPSPPPLTREEILLRNNGSMSLKKAAATFNVDLKTFKAKLLDENIFVWNDELRIHGENNIITIYIPVPEQDYVIAACEVGGYYPFESVIRIIEEEHNLTRGSYKLSYRHYNPSVGDVLIETDRDWHEAVLYAKSFKDLLLMDLKKYPVDDADVSSQIQPM